MYKLMINHSTRDTTFGEALCELLEKKKPFFAKVFFFHIDIEVYQLIKIINWIK